MLGNLRVGEFWTRVVGFLLKIPRDFLLDVFFFVACSASEMTSLLLRLLSGNCICVAAIERSPTPKDKVEIMAVSTGNH